MFRVRARSSAPPLSTRRRLGRAVYHRKRTWDSVTFHDENGVVDKTAFAEPDRAKVLPDKFLNNDLWLKKNGLRSWDD